MQDKSSEILKIKPHFEILDGLRGVAALAVVVFHFMEIVYSDYSKNFIGHGFLAVDFFFCLSGFVIGYAYDDRIKKMGVKAFIFSRLIRLHPLVIIGSVLGLVQFLFDPYIDHSSIVGAGKIVLVFISSIFLIPLPIMSERYFNLFNFNAPAWSLFWEYVANIFYVFILYKISRRYLFLLITFSTIAICFVCYKAGSLMGGWSGSTFWDGAVRISYSFLAGLFIYRSNWVIKTHLGFIAIAALLVLAFIMPYSKWNWPFEPMVVLFYFPVLIVLGSGATLSERFKKLCKFFGKISYPLYMTHYAAMWMFANYYNSHRVNTTQLSFIIIFGIITLVCIAYLIMLLYDIPIRKFLTAKRKNIVT